MARRSRLHALLLTAVMVPLATLVGLPFYYIVVNTFKTQSEMSLDPLGLPTAPTFENYAQILADSEVVRAFLNTVIVTGVSVVLMLLIGAMAAFGIVYRRSRIGTIVGGILLLAFLIPFQSTIIPLYQMVVGMGLVDTLQGLIAVYLGGAVFCYFLIVGYLRTVPGDIFEAARIDGAGPWRIFWGIALPLIRPVLITVGVFQVMWIWNDFIAPTIFLSSTENNTLVLLAYHAVSEFVVDWPLFMTVTVIVLVPMLAFFVTMQRYIVDGLVSGSVKG